MSIEKAIETTIREAIEVVNSIISWEKVSRSISIRTLIRREDLRMAYGMLKSNEFVPAEVHMMKELSKRGAS